MLIKRDFYINGRWVAPIAGRDCPVINPSNEEPIAVISLGSEADCDAAVAAARHELGAKWMWVSVVGQFAIAWLVAFLLFQGGKLLLG